MAERMYQALSPGGMSMRPPSQPLSPSPFLRPAATPAAWAHTLTQEEVAIPVGKGYHVSFEAVACGTYRVVVENRGPKRNQTTLVVSLRLRPTDRSRRPVTGEWTLTHVAGHHRLQRQFQLAEEGDLDVCVVPPPGAKEAAVWCEILTDAPGPNPRAHGMLRDAGALRRELDAAHGDQWPERG
eukprot:TRINITY_DN14100_c0_g1_i1.p1 TRINITY_DN14100_c0_g1~~TRINITY_DN14100_c0_g1_i1.p1  ORF type:complete len:190 (+),score=51.76 TRINITY_DN14100_c0_g1_i1:23-571(+)